MVRLLLIDANARMSGKRLTTLDVIGAGPRYVLSVLRRHGIDAVLEPYENVVTSKGLKDFDVLAVSFMISDVEAVRKLISWWKRRKPDGIVMLGGPGALSPNILEKLDFDLAIVGECELVVPEIVKKGVFEDRSRLDDLIGLKGVAVKLKGKVFWGGLAPWTPREVMEQYMPDTDSVAKYPFYWACRVYVEVVRGCSNFRRAKLYRECDLCNICRQGPLDARLRCPRNVAPGCGYCSVPSVHGPPRSRSIESIVSEVEKLLELGVTRIVLSAPDFLDYGRDLLVHPHPLTDPREPPPNIDVIEKLLSKLSALEPVLEGVACISIENVKPCLVNEYVAEVLGKYLKGTVVYIGLESGSDELLDRVGRPCSVSEAIRCIELLKKYGLRPYVYLMHGIPTETDDDVKKTVELVDLLEKIGVERIVLYRFRPLPFSAFEKAELPPPAIAKPSTRELYERVRKFNEARKRELLNRVIRAVIASSYPKKRGYVVAYPLLHGPTIVIRASRNYIGAVVDVKIVKVVSDRLVEGMLLRVRKRIVRIEKYARDISMR